MKIVMLLDNGLKSDRRVEKEAIALHKAGHEVCIYATDEEELPETDQLIEGIEIKRILGSWIRRPFSSGYRKAVQNIINSILSEHSQVIFCHDYFTLPIGAQVKASRPDVRLVFDSHEYLRGWRYYNEIKHPLNRIKGWLVWRYFLNRQNANLPKCDLVYCPTNSIATRLKADAELQQLPTPILNVPDKKPQQKLDVKALLGIPTDHVLIVHTGSIYHSDEQLEFTLNVFNRHDTAHLLFVGNRPKFYSTRRVVEESRMRHIHFIAYDDYPLLQLIAGCDIGLVHIRSGTYLNHKIGSSNKFMEYICCELPILSVDHEFHRNLNSKEEFIAFYHENDSASLESAIDRCIAEWKTFKRNVTEINTKYSWENESKKFLEAFELCINGR